MKKILITLIAILTLISCTKKPLEQPVKTTHNVQMDLSQDGFAGIATGYHNGVLVSNTTINLNSSTWTGTAKTGDTLELIIIQNVGYKTNADIKVDGNIVTSLSDTISSPKHLFYIIK